MAGIPKDNTLDSTPTLLSDGYNFIRNRCEELNSDVFETRLMLKKTICMRGEEAAKVFYDTERFERKKAAPKRLQKTLFGKGGVQGMDGEAHQNRKKMFMSLMSPESIERLISLMDNQWENYLKKWETVDELELFAEVEELIFRAVCQWAGIPVKEGKVEKRTGQISSLITSGGDLGLHHYEGRNNRKKAEKWIAKLVKKLRSGQITADQNTALYIISTHRDLEDNLLDERIAAVEILNVIRPTVAVGRFIIFLADALLKHPAYREKLQQDDQLNEWFVQEVRRFYPFFPFAAARVKKDFDWNGFHFPKGRRVLLDLYGTNHDSASWNDPDVFRPERFKDWDGSAHNFIPQGGGDHHKNHRCPGEWIAIESMKLALKYFTTRMDYDVPEQDLSMEMNDFPPIPKSKFIIKNIRQVQEV